MIINRNPSILVGKNYVYLVEKKDLVEFKNIEELTKNISQGQVDLILSNNTSYLKIFSFPLETTVNKNKIKLELQKEIPFDIDKKNWQYKLINKNKKTQTYWAFAPEPNSITPFAKSLEKNNLEIESLCSLPFLISQNIPKYKNPTLVIFQNKKIKFILIISENKIWTYDLSTNDDLKSVISNLIDSTKKHHKLEIEKIVAVSDQDLSSLKLKIEKIDFDFSKIKFIPMIENYQIEQKKEVEKKIQKNEEDQTNQDSQKPINEKDNIGVGNLKIKKKSIGLLLALGASIIFMLVTFWFRKPWVEKVPTEQTRIPTASEILEDELAQLESTPQPSPSPEFFANLYSVQILNGAGVAGLAGEIQATLEEDGFEDLEVGNADSSDYETTEIITQDDQLRLKLTEILEKDFEINPEPTSTSVPEEFDAIIILGQD